MRQQECINKTIFSIKNINEYKMVISKSKLSHHKTTIKAKLLIFLIKCFIIQTLAACIGTRHFTGDKS